MKIGTIRCFDTVLCMKCCERLKTNCADVTSYCVQIMLPDFCMTDELLHDSHGHVWHNIIELKIMCRVYASTVCLIRCGLI